jgi:hypothetical protein
MKKRRKETARAADLDILLDQLWNKDSQKHFKHERVRVQIALYLQMLSYSGSCPGALIVSDSYRNSNESLKYKVFGLYIIICSYN